MKVSREQMATNRIRILDEASRLFRARGFDAVTVSDVMKAAGQTHGGFYGHFASKDDLVARTIAHVMRDDGGSMVDVPAWIDAYLSPLHLDNPAQGCPMAGLAGQMGQQTPAARQAMAEGLNAQIERIAQGLYDAGGVGDLRREAIGQWATMVGALVMARAVDDPALADELLVQSRAWIDESCKTALIPSPCDAADRSVADA